MAKQKLTPAMRAVLLNLRAGRTATHHLYGRSAMGGYERTRIALLKAGFVRCSYGATVSLELTDAGRAALQSVSEPG